MKTSLYIKGSLMIRALVCACLFFSATFITADELRSPDDMQLVQQHVGCEVIERRDTDDCSSAVNAGNGNVDSDEVIIAHPHAARLPIYIPHIAPVTVAVVTPVIFSPAIRAPPAV